MKRPLDQDVYTCREIFQYILDDEGDADGDDTDQGCGYREFDIPGSEYPEESNDGSDNTEDASKQGAYIDFHATFSYAPGDQFG